MPGAIAFTLGALELTSGVAPNPSLAENGSAATDVVAADVATGDGTMSSASAASVLRRAGCAAAGDAENPKPAAAPAGDAAAHTSRIAPPIAGEPLFVLPGGVTPSVLRGALATYSSRLERKLFGGCSKSGRFRSLVVRLSFARS